MTLVLHDPRRAEPVPTPVSVPAPVPLPDEPLVEHVRPHRFTLEEYLRLSEMGFFEGGRVEFIDGGIYDMPAQKDSHAYGLTTASRWCNKAFDEGRYWVRVQCSLRVAGSLPEPDLAVLDFPATSSGAYASSDRAVLVIEVSDASLLADTTTKMSLYAAAGVRDYWVLSIPDRLLIVHRQPIQSVSAKHGWTYGEVRRFAPGESASPLALPAASVDPANLLA